jgi:hypothetical protein
MATNWDDMTYHEKLETLRRVLVEIHTLLTNRSFDEDETWDAMRGMRSELGKMSKDIATLKALWPKKYSRTADDADKPRGSPSHQRAVTKR